MEHCLRVAALVAFAFVSARGDTSAAKADTVKAGADDVVVEEEDIFSEITKQGIRLDGEEESIVVPEAAPVRQIDTAPEADSAVPLQSVPDSSRHPVAAEVDEFDSVAGEDEESMRRERRRGYDERYGPDSSPESPPSAQQPQEQIPLGPAKVEDVQSVNFARNVREYRSPKLAMFLSLLLPGAGQAYARNYWKSALFGVVEASVIGVSIAYHVKGDRGIEKAHGYADEHYDVDGTVFPAYYRALWSFFERKALADDSINPDKRMDDIYYRDDTTRPYLDIYSDERSSKTDDYYDWITWKSFAQGWDDCEPGYGDIFAADSGMEIVVGGTTYRVYDATNEALIADSAYLVTVPPDTHNVYYGISKNQATYMHMLSTGNSYYRTSLNVLFLLLANHIASAIDAGITAKRHNDKMLGKQSFLHRIHIDQQFVNTGTEVVPGYALRITF